MVLRWGRGPTHFLLFQQDIPTPQHPPFWGHIRKGGGQECPRADKTNTVGKKPCPRVWRTPSLPHAENTQRWLIPSDWSDLRMAPSQHKRGLCPLDFWDTHVRLEFVTHTPQDTHTPWNNTRLCPSSLPQGVIYPCGTTAYPCQERWQVPEQVSEQLSAWGGALVLPGSRGGTAAFTRGWGWWAACLAVLSKQESLADGDPSWTQECIKWEESPPGQGQWHLQTGTNPLYSQAAWITAWMCLTLFSII